MKDTDFQKLKQFYNAGAGLLPLNQPAIDLMDNTTKGEIVFFDEKTPRDLKFHKCYFSILSFIWEYLPDKFKAKVPDNEFYIFLKHLKGEYKIKFEFSDGTKWIEYTSISFNSMSQIRFKEYVKNQLPFIYTEVIGAFFKDEIYDNIIETIEKEYEKFFTKYGI